MSGRAARTLAGLPEGSLLRRMWWLRWQPGAACGHTGPVLVSLTEYRAARMLDVPAIYLTGARLRQGWYAMPGAVGMWLWGEPLGLRGGSLTVWQSIADQRRFVGLPAHIAIMRRYRERGELRSASWELERFDQQLIRAEGEARLRDR